MPIVIFLAISTVSIALLAYKTFQSFRRYGIAPDSSYSGDLPTVSVCVAARNETHALAQCLERILKSDYTKLEILVLDDSSTDDTSLIIKSFAGAGVRFIAGTPLPSNSLGKNHAYQTLIDEASGDYVLFLDVDTTINVTTISRLVATLKNGRFSMLSVLPRREDSYRVSAMLGTMRYNWELLLSSGSNPPAASALWMAERAILSQDGAGLRHYSASVRPERHLARQLHTSKRYSYIIGDPNLGVGFEKHLGSQHQTAVRLYYPMLGRSLIGFLGGLSFLASLLLPLITLVAPIFVPIDSALLSWALVLVAAMFAVMTFIASRTYGRIGRPMRTLLWPLILTQEIVLLVASLLAHTRRTVTWKGRSITAGPARAEALRIDD